MSINTKQYIEKYIKIRDKSGKIINLQFNEPQQRLYDIIKEQKLKNKPVRIVILKARQLGFSTIAESILFKETTTINEGKRYPKRISKFKRETGLHPTQKPVPLLEYLIKTYTNEGDLVLDFTMGSGSTGVACSNLNRRFIGIELDENYFNIAKERMENFRKIV